MKVTVIGLGYVGLSNALVLSKNEDVVAYDIDKNKIDLLQKKKSVLQEKEIENLIKENSFIRYTSIWEEALKHGQVFIIATPTNFDEIKETFDTTTIKELINNIISYNKKAICIIKSTIPIGFTKEMNIEFQTDTIFFCPEFLREGHAILDNLWPSRVIVGGENDIVAKTIIEMFTRNASKKQIPTLTCTSDEAEAIKLFSNTYLAMRVCFFNELDTFCEVKKIRTKKVIEGVCLDDRIGNGYNNPSFGFGGYCLPKDSDQLIANYINIPSRIIKSIHDSNELRKRYIVEQIMERNPKTIGIYRLTMKAKSDNFRNSSILEIISKLNRLGKNIVIYEPMCEEHYFDGIPVMKDLKKFEEIADLVIANRTDEKIKNFNTSIYSRDLFNRE